MRIILKYWMLGILFLYCFIAVGQKENSIIVDSLLNELNTATTDTAKVYTLCELTRYYNSINTERSLEYGNKALQLAQQIGFENGKANALYQLGLTYKLKGESSKALNVFLRMKQIAENSKNNEALYNSYTAIGNIYNNQGKYEKAFELYQQRLKLAEDNLDTLGIAIAKANIAKIFLEKEELNKAIVTYIEILPILKRFKSYKNLTSTYILIGNVLTKQKKHQRAIVYYDTAYVIGVQHNDWNNSSIAKYNIGDVLKTLEQYSDAIVNMENALQIATKSQISKVMLVCTESLSEIYATTGNYEKAYEYNKQYLSIKEMLLNEANTRSLNEMQTKYETEKKQKEIELLNKEKEKQTALSLVENKRKNTIIFSIIGGLVLVTLFSIFLFNRFQTTRKQKNIIENQKEIVEEKQKEITDSITYAKRIQEAILPPQTIIKDILPNSFFLYKPKDIVSGDFYWLEQKNNEVLFAAVDCTGHGVPGAFVSIVGHNGLTRAINEFGLTQPAQILNKLNELVEETLRQKDNEVRDGMDISLCSINFSNNQLQYAGANNPLYLVRNGEILITKADKQPIGGTGENKTFTNHTIELQKGDSIYIFSDGFADQFGGIKDKKYGYSQFRKLLLSIQNRPMLEQLKSLDTEFNNWKGKTEQLDDVCVIGLRI